VGTEGGFGLSTREGEVLALNDEPADDNPSRTAYTRVPRNIK
jgi:hypothetical protein